jgi:cobalt/nickel transport system permease protein
MHHRTVEQLAASDSPIHRLDPRVKLLVLLCYVICVAVLPAWPVFAFIPFLLFSVTALAIARLPAMFVVSRVMAVLPFVFLVAVFLPFTRGQDVLFRPEGFFLTVYKEGTLLALGVLMKGVLAILGVCCLVFTTPFSRLLLALRHFKMPKVLVAVLGFLFRYLDLLADESLRVRRARRLRSLGRARKMRWRSTGGMVGRLLLRTLDRAERVHRCMVARGYDGEVRVLDNPGMKKSDLRFGFFSGCALLCFVVVSWFS